MAEWDRGRLLGRSRPWPYVGVRITPRQTDQGRRRELTAAVSPVRTAFTDTRTATWPAWQYVTPPPAETAVDPEALAMALWARLREVWDLAAPALDQLHAGRRDGAAPP